MSAFRLFFWTSALLRLDYRQLVSSSFWGVAESLAGTATRPGREQAAEKGLIAEENGSDGIPQGLKPMMNINLAPEWRQVVCK
jgi:hypothetical protein